MGLWNTIKKKLGISFGRNDKNDEKYRVLVGDDAKPKVSNSVGNIAKTVSRVTRVDDVQRTAKLPTRNYAETRIENTLNSINKVTDTIKKENKRKEFNEKKFQKKLEEQRRKNVLSDFQDYGLTKEQIETVNNTHEGVGTLAKSTTKKFVGGVGSAFGRLQSNINNSDIKVNSEAWTEAQKIAGFNTMSYDEQQKILEPLREKHRKLLSEKDKVSANEKLLKKTDKLIESGQQDIEKLKEGKSSAAKFGIDLVSGLMDFGVDAGIGLLTGGGALPSMFLRAAGQSAYNAEKEGASREKALLYGATSGGLEVATEKLTSVAKPLSKVMGKGFADDFVNKTINKYASKLAGEGSKKALYHGSKMLASAVGEGLEEMVAEGLDPLIANKIYADAIGQHKDFSLKDVAYSGLLGASMGGLLGGSGQIVEQSRFNNNAERNEYDAEKIINQAKRLDENSPIYKTAVATEEMLKNGEQVPNIQYEIFKQEIERDKAEQEKAYENTINSAYNVAKKDGLAMPVMDMTDGRVDLSENTERVYGEVFNKAFEEAGNIYKDGFNELEVEDVANAIADITVGSALPEHTDLFMPSQVENRKLYEAVTGEKLPSGNVQTRQYLFDRIGNNFLKAAQEETIFRNDVVQGEVLQKAINEFDAKGQDEFARYIKDINEEDTDMYSSLFNHYYKGGQSNLAFETVARMNPVGNDVFSSELKRSAYKAGVADSMKNPKLGNVMAGTSFDTKKGRVVVNTNKATASEIKLIKRAANVLNKDIEIIDNEEMRNRLPEDKRSLSDSEIPNGYYENGKIVINKDADRPLAIVFSHELTHDMKENNPEAYKQFRDFVIGKWNEKDSDGLKQAIEDKIRQYSSATTLTEEDAIEEILADSTYEFVQDEDIIREICRSNRTLAQAILDGIQRVIEKLKSILGVEVSNYAPKVRKDFYKELGILEDVAKMWEDGIVNIKETTENSSGIKLSLKNKNIDINTKIPVVEHTGYIDVPLNDYTRLKILQDKVRGLKRGVYENKATGYRADINSKTVNKILHPTPRKFNPWKDNYVDNLNAAIYLPELFENAVYVDTKSNQKIKNANKQIKGFHHFVAPVEMNEDIYRVLITAREKSNSNMLYIVKTELLAIEKEDIVVPNIKDGNLSTISSLEISIPDLVDDVKIYDYNQQADITYNSNDIKFSMKEIDKEYMQAVEQGDMETAQRLVNEMAERKGYVEDEAYRDTHSAPRASITREDFENLDILQELAEESEDLNLYAIANGVSIVPDDFFTYEGARLYGYNNEEGMQSLNKIRKAIDSIQRQTRDGIEEIRIPTVRVYRAIPKDVKEDRMRSGGQWVTPSREYAKKHGQSRFGANNYRIIQENVLATELWWDGNDINEWGFDDGKNYAYRNTKNNKKLLDAVTYDNEGNVIPLSKRFNYREYSPKFSMKEDFATQVDDVLNDNKNFEQTHLYMGETPKVLTDLGLRNLPMLITAKHIYTMAKDNGKYKKVNYHGMGADLIKQLPQAIAEPIGIIESATRTDSVVVLTELIDKENRPVITAIKFDGFGNYNDVEIEANVVTSGYGKDNITSFIREAFDEDRVLYWNNKKAGTINTPGIQFPNNIDNSDFADNVSRFKEKVNGNEKKYQLKEERLSDLESQFDKLVEELDKVSPDSKQAEELIQKIDKLGEKIETQKAKNKKIEEDVKAVEEKLIERYNEDDLALFYKMPKLLPRSIRAKQQQTKTHEELMAEVEYLKGEVQRTYGKIPERKDIEKKANMFVRSWLDGKRTNLALVDMMTDNIMQIASDIKNGRGEDAVLTAYDVAREIACEIDYTPNHILWDVYMGLNEYLRTTSIRLTERDKANITDWSSVLRRNFGKIKLVNATNEFGSNIENVYAEMSELFPEVISGKAEVTDDMIAEIIEVREAFESLDYVLEECEFEQMVKEIANDILETAAGIKPKVTHADKIANYYKDKINILEGKFDEALKELKADFKSQKKEIQDKEKAKYRETREKQIAKAKERHEKKLAKQKAYYENKEAKRKDTSERKRYKASIEKNVKWLSDRLIKPTDKKHLPDSFRRLVADFLKGIDMQSDRSKSIEKKTGKKALKTLEFEKLQRAYEEIAKEDGSGLFEYDGYIVELMKALKIKLDGKSIDQATTANLKDMDTILKSIKFNIDHINKAFNENLQSTISEKAEDIIDYTKKVKRKSDRTGVLGAIDRLLNESMVTPSDMFELLGSGMHSVYMEMRKGFDKHIENISTTRDFFGDLFTKFFNKKKPGSALEKWRDASEIKTFELQSGFEITLNPAQIMSLYCLNKREQAQTHIYGSGIVASEVDTAKALKKALGAKKLIQGEAVQVTPEDVSNIIASLNEEQTQIADALMEYLNTTCADWGNETSMRLYGYKKFTEKNYFPIKSADAYLDSNFENRETKEKIKNFGFTKGTVVNANNPIIVADIFEVVADHINKMSLYNGLAVPISDFQRVYNYRERKADGTVGNSVKGRIKTTFGEKPIKYIETFMADINNNVNVRDEGLTRVVNKLLANYKKAAIGFNLRVFVQQPTAIARAFMLISPKYFVGIKRPLKEAREMQKYCPIAKWKNWGHSQTDVARDLDDIMMNKTWTKFDIISMRPYGFADDMTWGVIWSAVKREVKAEHKEVKVGSEEFFKLCSDRASQIYDKTQVVDSPFHRSQVMRNKGTMEKMMSSFMAEPTRTFNMVRTEMLTAKQMWTDGEKGKATKKMTRAMSVYVANAALVSAAAAIVDAMRGKNPDKDDEEERTQYELYLLNLLNNLDDNMNPLNQIVGIKDLYQLKDGWGSSNMALEGFESLWKNISDWQKVMNGESDKSTAELTRSGLEAIGMITGVPGKNILREIETFFPEAFAAEKDAGKKAKDKYEYKETLWDKIKRIFGTEMSSEEEKKKGYEKRLEQIKDKVDGLSGEEYEDVLWQEVTGGYTKLAESGDFETLDNMRKTFKDLGEDELLKKFNKSVESKVRTRFKKSIGEEYGESDKFRAYLEKHYDYKEAQFTDLYLKSDTAKAFQEAVLSGDDDAAVDACTDLILAGATEYDLDVLWWNRTKSLKALDYAEGTIGQPVTGGTITSNFGYRNAPTSGASTYHQGIDIAAPMNSEIYASDGGKVSSVSYTRAGGNTVKISHGNGRYTVYKHMNAGNVLKGDIVRKGDVIGFVGSTGISTGPHLHFELIQDGEYIDPSRYW